MTPSTKKSLSKQNTVLIVDNNQINVGILFEYLSSNDYRVLVARDGESAIKRAHAANPDLILLDVLMPGLNGFETCRQLKTDPATQDIPVIFMTGLTETEDKIKGFEAGGVDYLVKPLQLVEVLARVKTHLRLRHLVGELKTANEVLSKRADYLEINKKIGEKITAILNLNDLLLQIVKFIRVHFRYSLVGIWLLNKSLEQITLKAIDTQSSDSLEVELSYSLDSSNNIITNVCKTGQTYHSPKFQSNQEIIPTTKTSVLAIALKIGNTLLGVLNIQKDGPTSFDTEENAVLHSLGHQIAIAIRNAQLYQIEKQRLSEIEAANKELEMFSYSVSHDLRAPLRVINGFCNILTEDYSRLLPEEGQEAVRKITSNTNRMGQLINDLQVFFRFSHQDLSKTSVLPGNLITQVRDELQHDLAGREVRFLIGDLPECQADPSLFKQVWVNLLSNAYKYTRKCKITKIEIGSLKTKDEEPTTYYIKDNGVGFNMEYADKLFGVFQRLHSGQEFEGTGVGLAIVKRIIQRHGGRIWAESSENNGAAFYFTLE